jgi:hypothetical protein
MRQHKQGAVRQRGMPGSVQTGGRILDLSDFAHLPQRERLQLLGPDRPDWPGQSREPGMAPCGVIVDDLLDGYRVYAEPPHYRRPTNRLGRLFHRMSAPVLLFVVLACAQACVGAVGLWKSGPLPSTGASAEALRAAYFCALSLLPAAVLVWRPDAWHSARLLLVGTIVWTSVPSTATLVGRAAGLDSSPEGSTGMALGLAVGAAGILASLGPLIMVFGLERLRRAHVEWLWPLTWQAATAAIVPIAYSATRWLPFAGGRQGPAWVLDTSRLPDALAGAAAPVEVLGLGILGGLGLYSLLTDEPGRRFWQCLTAGALLLFGVGVGEFFSGTLNSQMVAAEPGAAGPYAVVAVLLAAGGGLVMLAFAAPVWSADEDADGLGRGAPDDVFAWGPSGWDYREPIPMGAVLAVAAGADHALAVDRLGRVGAWGNNSLGQLDVPEGLSEVVAVAAGDGFSLALRASGTVAAWGDGERGQTAVPAGLTGVTAIAAGRSFGLALRSDGTVVGWGDPADGVVPVPPNLTGVTAISAGAHHALALRENGTVAAWGDDGRGQCWVPASLSGVTAISAGGEFSLALRADGTVAAWGDDRYGQLDVPEGMTNVTAISAGAFHAVALLGQGDVLGWGGGRTRGEADHPWRLVDFKAVAAGDGFSLAIRAA